MKDYTIILADDHQMIREGIRKLITEVAGLSVIGEAGDGNALLKLLSKQKPDMVILDISMPDMRGIEAAREIHILYPDVRILFLSMHRRENFLSMALQSGAAGYLLKEDSGDELIRAIEQIRNGRTYLSAKLAEEFHSSVISICRGDRKNENDPLTTRERQVLQMIAEGNTDSRIADKLCISLRTVQRHHANIRAKLGCRHTADLVRRAIEYGLLNHLT